jgi:3-deoxy-D-manno-octulosonate 8-phosphate phosphatase (KDO 8-P phosphatase)
MSAFRSSITPAIVRQAQRIRLAAFDIDGVMSDGTLAYTDSGSETKAFHTLDGHGLKALTSEGMTVAIITARSNPVVQRRAEELRIGHVMQGSVDKLASLTVLVQRLDLSLSQCAFMGDDCADLRALQACGLACSVPHAPLVVRQSAHYVTRRAGGAGAVREFCDLLLRARRGARPE